MTNIAISIAGIDAVRSYTLYINLQTRYSLVGLYIMCEYRLNELGMKQQSIIIFILGIEPFFGVYRKMHYIYNRKAATKL